MSPDFGYNVAPYETRPWTNWPDFLSDLFPAGQTISAVVGEEAYTEVGVDYDTGIR